MAVFQFKRIQRNLERLHQSLGLSRHHIAGRRQKQLGQSNERRHQSGDESDPRTIEPPALA
jgi:hypothetical protein